MSADSWLCQRRVIWAVEIPASPLSVFPVAQILSHDNPDLVTDQATRLKERAYLFVKLRDRL